MGYTPEDAAHMARAGADWKTPSQRQKKKTALRRREYALEFLVRHAIEYVEMNGGDHLRCTRDGKTADYWPGSGRVWSAEGADGRGLDYLLEYFAVAAVTN